MNKKAKKDYYQLYQKPLPLILSSDYYYDLPEVFPHNPLSWIYFAYHYMKLTNKTVPQSFADRPLVIYEAGAFKVKDEKGMNKLWREGFFGKGSLSRSDPSWNFRINRRLNLFTDEKELTVEDITRIRREERMKFKNERSKLDKLKLKERQGILSSEEKDELSSLEEQLSHLRNSDIRYTTLKEDFDYDKLRPEDRLVVDEKSGKLNVKLEHLSLSPSEVFFLNFALNIIDVSHESEILSTRNLFHLICGLDSLKPDNEFIMNYVVYHHYRSLGWCVRSGIKFGTDYLLYKRGPLFTHAEFAVYIVADGQDHAQSWYDMSTVLRVVSGTKKYLVLVYVDVPSENKFNNIFEHQPKDDKQFFCELFSLYKVREVLLKRWSPSRTRD